MVGDDAHQDAGAGARGQVRVYIATSLDGFIAGPNDDLTWLTATDSPNTQDDFASGALTYEEFIGGIGALLMGRRTYDVVRGFDIPWPYGDRPVLVATNRPIDPDPTPFVRAVGGSIQELVAAARKAAEGQDVYIDGGALIRQALEADLVDDLTVTLAPIALGAGIPLFAGLPRHYPLKIVAHHSFDGGMVQLRMKPA